MVGIDLWYWLQEAQLMLINLHDVISSGGRKSICYCHYFWCLPQNPHYTSSCEYFNELYTLVDSPRNRSRSPPPPPLRSQTETSR